MVKYIKITIDTALYLGKKPWKLLVEMGITVGYACELLQSDERKVTWNQRERTEVASICLRYRRGEEHVYFVYF